MSMHDPYAPHVPAKPRKKAEAEAETQTEKTEEPKKTTRRTPVKRATRKKADSDS